MEKNLAAHLTLTEEGVLKCDAPYKDTLIIFWVCLLMHTYANDWFQQIP